jgi:hypothetical protein
MSAVTWRATFGPRLGIEALEDRTTPTAAYTLSAGALVSFDTDTPGTSTSAAVTGVAANESLVGIDFRAADGELYALGVNATANTGTLYTIDTQTGAATAVGATGAVKFVDGTGKAVDLPDPGTVDYGLDFDPAEDRLRVVTGTGLNFRIDATAGTPVDGNTGSTTAVAGTTPDGAINGLPTGSIGVGATAFVADASGSVTQYTLDAASDSLYIQSPSSGGTQTARLNVKVGSAALNFTRAKGFDIGDAGAFAALTVSGTTHLYQIDLNTGAATDLGAAPAGATGLALAPPVATPVEPAGEIAFDGATYTATEAGGTATITLARTGGTAGEVTVTVTATDGTATAGSDFAAGPYTVTFADGQTSATLAVPLVADTATEGDETFTLTVSAPTGGATLGAQATATVTITDAGAPVVVPPVDEAPVPIPVPPVVTPPVQPGFVVGSGAGADTVQVLNADGSVRLSFSPYGPGMVSGVHVATGDVTGDGVADIITTPAMGAPHVKVFDGDRGELVRSFYAFDATFMGGLSVASGDVNGDGRADIVVGTATGSSHVKAFDAATGGLLASFYAYGAFGGGVNVAAGDVNGDGRADIITGTATESSHVKVFSGRGLAVLQSTFAFVGHNGGVTVAAGDTNGDGKADVIVGTATGTSQVKVYSGATRETLRNFRAYPFAYTGGVSVAARDINGDGLADILSGTAAETSHVKGFDGGTAAEINSFLAFGAGFGGGVFIA